MSAEGAAGPARLRVTGLRSALAGPFDLEVAAGECVVVTGASGAGKSLFLRLIADLDPGEGEVTLAGRGREAFAPPDWRRRVGYVPAEPGWWAPRVRDHFGGGGGDRLAALAGGLGLSARVLEAATAELSTGERQRLALVRALLQDPEVLLLDEPTGALDALSVGRVETLLRDLVRRGLALVVATHDETLAASLATRRFVMAERRLRPA